MLGSEIHRKSYYVSSSFVSIVYSLAAKKYNGVKSPIYAEEMWWQSSIKCAYKYLRTVFGFSV